MARRGKARRTLEAHYRRLLLWNVSQKYSGIMSSLRFRCNRQYYFIWAIDEIIRGGTPPISFVLHRQFPAFQRCLKFRRSDWLAEIIIHSYRQALISLTLHGISSQGNNVDRRFPRTRLLQTLLSLANGQGGFVSVHLRHLTVHE